MSVPVCVFVIWILPKTRVDKQWAQPDQKMNQIELKKSSHTHAHTHTCSIFLTHTTKHTHTHTNALKERATESECPPHILTSSHILILLKLSGTRSPTLPHTYRLQKWKPKTCCSLVWSLTLEQYTHTHTYTCFDRGDWCGVATVSRIDKIIGLFCKRDL